MDDELRALLARRQDARQRRDWPESDRVRGEIADAGRRVVDTPEGPVLEPLR
ncbi:CysS/YqeB C-terminal domain-containing protein [Dactylosporangium sp. CA-139114]|uniref:CysS/YqeB C-terminal domain-containing protein n=1 Tax=Dactylosporangium sp. CA-139114 TaxID=3239931 RepID=UPI003D97BEC0